MTRVTTGNNTISRGFSNNHKANDIHSHGNEKDNQVKAHSEGIVVWVQTEQKNNTKATGNKSYGNAVKIKHSNGMYTLYAHLKSVKVKKGQYVAKGTIIGLIGNTGKSFGPHLHWEIRDKNNKRINPTQYLNKDLPNLPTGNKLKLLYDKCLRKSPEVKVGNKIKKIKKNTIVQCYDNEIFKDKYGNRWIKTTLSGVTGYICIYDSTGVQAKEV